MVIAHTRDRNIISPGRIICTFIDNEYIHKMYNADLFLNTVNWLAEEEALISIRPKTTRGSRVLMTPKETRDIFYMSVLILPETLLLFGLAVWWRRR